MLSDHNHHQTFICGGKKHSKIEFVLNGKLKGRPSLHSQDVFYKNGVCNGYAPTILAGGNLTEQLVTLLWPRQG